MNGAMSGYNSNGNIGLKITKFHPDDVVYWEIPSTKSNTNGANDSTNFPHESVAIRHNRATTLSHIDGHADVMTGVDYNALCRKGPGVLWCDPTAIDGGLSKGGTIPNPITMQE